ncbi:MAG: alpha/beta hydrolase family protein [Verrucomicrobiota bacterium]|nr:alpha/beta hydrolase family protein [Verrucomicrobiota bacterium]
MHPFIHKPIATLLDGATFRLLNFWHFRHGVHASSPEALEKYASQWSGKSFEFFELKAQSDIPLEERPSPEPKRVNYESPVPCDIPCNNYGYIDVFQAHPWNSVPCVILSHGFMSASDTGYRMWCRLLNKNGMNAVFFHLPYHYARRPKGYVSGELAVSADLIRVAEGIRQSVVELRYIIRSLNTQGCPRVGLFGMSYGGWVSALTAGLEGAVKMGVLIEPILDIEHVMWDCPATRTMRRQLSSRGVSKELVHSMFHLVSPFQRKPASVDAQILMLAGEYDRIAPAAAIKRLSQEWGGHYREYRQGHVGYKLQHAGWRDMQELLLPTFLAGENTHV